MKAVVAAFNQEKALVGAFSVIVQLHQLIVYTATLQTGQTIFCGTFHFARLARALSQLYRVHHCYYK